MTDVTWRGREEVLAGLRSMRRLGHAGPESGNRHVVTNQEVRTDGDHATARSYFLLVSSDTPAAILTVGAYRDELTRSGDHWLLTRREVVTRPPDEVVQSPEHRPSSEENPPNVGDTSQPEHEES